MSKSGGPLTAAVLAGVHIYTRLPSDGTHVGGAATRTAAEVSGGVGHGSLLSRLASGSLARRQMVFRMRDGSRIGCRVVDSGGVLSVHVDQDYDLPQVDWPNVRSIVDIGAHVGSFTVWAALRAPNCRVLAVEPNPHTFELLERNIRNNGLQHRVTAINAAVGAAPGELGLELVAHSLGTRLARQGPGEVRVRVQTLAGLLDEAGIEQVDILKIDCEGTEYEVFETTSLETLKRTAALACEYHPEPGRDVTSLEKIFRSAGFRVQRPAAHLGVLWATR